eukprot:CAMPEP_0172491478 /NCGR_PEP_ID=MMETSP1066-20121228/22326_1 /TAXON_ID=671091 /ORGANISM="Coscinodiscus wailesii, Strain CCMP2513" /LENGTH=231 /DNA_ID=CAMNT_0013260551 /DNA_START=128 /DNA_END=822 /DNA_ORIENTATION=-
MFQLNPPYKTICLDFVYPSDKIQPPQSNSTFENDDNNNTNESTLSSHAYNEHRYESPNNKILQEGNKLSKAIKNKNEDTLIANTPLVHDSNETRHIRNPHTIKTVNEDKDLSTKNKTKNDIDIDHPGESFTPADICPQLSYRIAPIMKDNTHHNTKNNTSTDSNIENHYKCPNNDVVFEGNNFSNDYKNEEEDKLSAKMPFVHSSKVSHCFRNPDGTEAGNEDDASNSNIY